MLKQFVTIISLLTLVNLNVFCAESEFEAVPGEYIVKLKQENSVLMFSTNKIQAAQRILGQGSQVKDVIPEFNIAVVKRAVFETVQSSISILENNPNVEYVEPNYIYRINKTPNDLDFGKLWGLKNIGQKSSDGKLGVVGIDINAEKAWDIETGSDKILVAIIDTGIDYNHNDIKNNMWFNETEKNGKQGIDDDNNGIIDDIYGANFVNAEKPTGNPMDDHGHGTHCAGVIGGQGDDGKGIVGVNWNVRLLAAKFLSADGSGSLEGALKAISYANKMGAKVQSNSWGGGGFTQSLKDAIEETNKSGAVFVAAAGNESNNNDKKPSYPASYDVPNIISVAAIDNQGKIASFSNYGKKSVHVAAPGVAIYSSIKENAYDSWSGTSMATPHVSGVAALLLAKESHLKGVEVKNRILSTARPIAGLKDKVSTGALVDAYATLTNTMPAPDVNDPANWKSINFNLDTAHPYKSKTNETFDIQAPAGTKEFSIYFSKFETEKNFDIVTITDKEGRVVHKISGPNNDSYSAVITGETAKITFVSDESSEGFGFKIDRIHYR